MQSGTIAQAAKDFRSDMHGIAGQGHSNYTGPMDPDGLREEITLSDLDVQLAVSHNRYGESLRCTLSG